MTALRFEALEAATLSCQDHAGSSYRCTRGVPTRMDYPGFAYGHSFSPHVAPVAAQIKHLEQAAGVDRAVPSRNSLAALGGFNSTSPTQCRTWCSP